MMGLTEACFQLGHLDFVGDKSWVEYRDGVREEIPAMRTNQGTTPVGKTWTRNPIPSWKCATGSPHSGRFAGIAGNPSDCKEFNFHPPQANLAGYGYSEHQEELSFMWSIVDKVQVPANLDGDYVLSWRWDSEQTPQVWAHCANVKIVEPTTTTTTSRGQTTTTRVCLPPDECQDDQHMHEKWEAHPESVCRLHEGDTSHDGGGSIDHKGHMLDSHNIETCKFACMQEASCKGVEFHPEQHHCEIWNEDIGFILKKPGYQCHKLTKRPSILLAETNGHPVVVEPQRRIWATLHMAIVPGIATAAVLAAMAVRRMVCSTTSRLEPCSDEEGEQTLVY